MYPKLISLPTGLPGVGSLDLPSYFSMVTIGFILATIMIRRWAKWHGIRQGLMIDYIIWMAIWGVLGSRVLHVIADGHFWDYVHVCTNPGLVDWKVDERECRALAGIWDVAKNVCHPATSNCLAFADVTAGGFAFYGGFVAAAIFTVYFTRRNNLPLGKIVDLASWTLILGLAWGRMGCFLASCCFGMRTDSWLGVVFPGGSAASRNHFEHGWIASYRLESLPVHPTQLYESFAGWAIAAIAYFWIQPRKRFDGQVFCIVSSLYAIARFLLEFIRRDERGGFFGLSTSQLIALAFIVGMAFLWPYFKRRAMKT